MSDESFSPKGENAGVTLYIGRGKYIRGQSFSLKRVYIFTCTSKRVIFELEVFSLARDTRFEKFRAAILFVGCARVELREVRLKFLCKWIGLENVGGWISGCHNFTSWIT